MSRCFFFCNMFFFFIMRISHRWHVSNECETHRWGMIVISANVQFTFALFSPSINWNLFIVSFRNLQNLLLSLTDRSAQKSRSSWSAPHYPYFESDIQLNSSKITRASLNARQFATLWKWRTREPHTCSLYSCVSLSLMSNWSRGRLHPFVLWQIQSFVFVLVLVRVFFVFVFTFICDAT